MVDVFLFGSSVVGAVHRLSTMDCIRYESLYRSRGACQPLARPRSGPHATLVPVAPSLTWRRRGVYVRRMGDAPGRLDSDLRIALLTGAAGWRDRDSSYTVAELAAVAALLACVAAVVTVLLVSAGLPAGSAAVVGGERWVVAVIGGLTLVLAVAPSFAWPLGWRPRRAGPALGFA